MFDESEYSISVWYRSRQQTEKFLDAAQLQAPIPAGGKWLKLRSFLTLRMI